MPRCLLDYGLWKPYDNGIPGGTMAARLGIVLFWIFILIAGAWLLLARSVGLDQDSPAITYVGAGIILAVGWALRYILTRGRLG